MSLDKIRGKIDKLDEKIIGLLNQRVKCALEVGKSKKKTGQSIYAPARESQVYKRLVKLSKDGLIPADSLKAIYREIMSASIALEKPVTISFLGPEATYTHLASLAKFGSSLSYAPAGSIQDVFRDVEQGRADYGVIPVENSIEGAVTHALDMFMESDLKICSEIYFAISHNLMTHVRLEDIQRVYSHPQVFAQCRMWIERTLHKVQLIDTPSTAVAASKVSQYKDAAAIGSSLAAKLYGLPVIAEGIQDFSGNVTRFLVISKQIPDPTGKDKTSILLSMKDKVGVLHEMLAPIKKYKVNMTKIESRPSKRKAWDYFFYIDFEGHVGSPKIKKMLAEIEQRARHLKVLGSYPMSLETSEI